MDKAREYEQDLEKRAGKLEDQLVLGQVDTTDTKARYLGYLARLRPVLISSTRYLAYSSDVGESFRPVVAPRAVTAAYGISWAYVTGDVAYEGYKARMRAHEMAPEAVQQVVGLTVAKRAIFQATASMLLPSLTIHTIVKYSALWVKKQGIQSIRIRQWLPSALGLGMIPFLPTLFDEPVEQAVDSTFDRIERSLYPDADSPVRKALEAGKHHTHSAPVEAIEKKV
ncbi:Mitochondrial 18 kDa protein [Rhodotorula toruloides]|uniref:Mitochondrial fission process protein 1 n=1 Tax=Rhodotorula toruloides TaxID=5286 RepID=A0A0K3CIC9_RHOTO|nr:Mitochondrial 18 kDa protein [Rhodotorula toruloides]PRQ73439.1 Mitochondrial 18 KDa protein (MTP18)-domain containing protein [Rhodotorula toruloides]